ncbi:MAG: nicotinamidase [Gemmatimonadetes bacterium]|nr:nicotinamidase [Gemmatimonadota bacterium]
MTGQGERAGELPIPEFYDPANAGRWAYTPDQEALFHAAVAWRERFGLRPAVEDARRIHLLLIDLQKDFCFPEGTLFVAGRSGRGAVDDNDRVARFVYRNLHRVSHITCTLDTHFPYQIFFPAFWLDETGAPPPPNREVSVDDIRQRRLRPNPAVAAWIGTGDYDWLLHQVEFYTEQLAAQGKYRLYLWPPHCILGSDGHALAGVVHEARMFHAYARISEARIELKGATPLTEYYSVIGPEVLRRFDGKPLAQRNRDFLDILARSDAVVIAGQAASHCVKSTIEDLLEHLDPALTRKVYILRDCMSAVTVPDPDHPGAFLFDFTPHAEAALRRFADAGMHVVESTTPMDEWPDLPV